MSSQDKPRASVTICNRKGMHARASAKFVKCAESFDADVRVMRDGNTVDGTSIMGLMMLAAGPGTVIVLEAEGPEGPEAIEALVALIEAGFGEEKWCPHRRQPGSPKMGRAGRRHFRGRPAQARVSPAPGRSPKSVPDLPVAAALPHGFGAAFRWGMLCHPDAYNEFFISLFRPGRVV